MCKISFIPYPNYSQSQCVAQKEEGTKRQAHQHSITHHSQARATTKRKQNHKTRTRWRAAQARRIDGSSTWCAAGGGTRAPGHVRLTGPDPVLHVLPGRCRGTWATAALYSIARRRNRNAQDRSWRSASSSIPPTATGDQLV